MNAEKNYLENGKSYARKIAARYGIRYGQLERGLSPRGVLAAR